MKDEETDKGNLDQLTRVEDLRKQVEELHGGVGLSFKSDDHLESVLKTPIT
ncbi:MAG: hypothetical protein IPG76_14730 [Acidobacteria bacterium]|nr:hypothetical protein [Acidobacteriota bacterium]